MTEQQWVCLNESASITAVALTVGDGYVNTSNGRVECHCPKCKPPAVPGLVYRLDEWHHRTGHSWPLWAQTLWRWLWLPLCRFRGPA